MAVKGHVDGMLGAYLTGWAMTDPGQGNCHVEIFDPVGEIVGAGRASRMRADLAVLGLGRTSFGFRIAVDNPATPRLLRVTADGVELPGSPVATGAGIFDSDCHVSGDRVLGWITERVAGFEPPLITVLDQYGVKAGEGRAIIDPEEQDRRAAKAFYDIELGQRCFGAGELRLGVLANGRKFTERGAELRLAGNLEQLGAESCHGWLLSPDQPGRSFEIDVYRDGELVGTTTCDIPREDVRSAHPHCLTPGFSVVLPRLAHGVVEASTLSLRLAGSDVELFKGPYVIGSRAAAVAAAHRAARLGQQGLEGIGAAERAVIQLALGQFLATARQGNGFSASLQPDPMLTPAPRPRLTIIVPVYKGVEITRACILSVLAHRDPETDRLVLIDDQAPEPEMARMLHGLSGAPNVFLLSNEANRGFVGSVNRGLGFAAGGDVLLLNSDTVLYPGGLDEMCRIAGSAAEIGTVTAMSNNATIFSYPHPNLARETLPDIGWSELAAEALLANAGLAVEVPTGHGFCMLIKAVVLRRVGLLDEALFGRGYGEENDFCQRAADLGYRHVAAAGVIVQHRESVSFTTEKASLLAANLPRLNTLYPEFTPLIMDFERRDGLRQARWALDRLRLGRAVAAGAGFALIITNQHDGGTAKAVHDIGEAADDYGDAVQLCLRVRGDGFIELLCKAPELHAVFAPSEVEPMLALLQSAAPRLVLVHQLLGFPAGFVERLGGWAAGKHTVFYVHDFYAICPRVTMIDAVGRFCDVAAAETCARCVAMGGAHETSKMTELTPAAHRALFGGLLRGFRHVVAPSANAAGYLRRVFPDLAVQAVPHPESAEAVAATARAGGDDGEVVLLGAIGPHKGSARLLRIAQQARLTHPQLSFRVIGYTDIDRQLTAIGNVTVTGRYTADQLPGLVAEAGGRFALFLHAWPETYSYTLSEAARYGFIPLVPDIGAPAARVRSAGFGFVFPFPFEAEQVLDCIEAARTGLWRVTGAPAMLFPTAADVTATRVILGVESGAAVDRGDRLVADCVEAEGLTTD